MKQTHIAVSKLRPFEKNPYQIRDDAEMDALVESVRENGVLTPLIVRPIENTDEYEVISGHRRLHAAVKAGITEIPALIYALDRDAAAIAVVDSNLHREHILPSEKALAYKLKRDAIAHQGTSRQFGEKWSVSQISDSANESERQIHRYIRLTHLILEFLEKMDQGEIALSVGVELSFLDESSQREVLEQCAANDCTPPIRRHGGCTRPTGRGRLPRRSFKPLCRRKKQTRRPASRFQWNASESTSPRAIPPPRSRTPW